VFLRSNSPMLFFFLRQGPIRGWFPRRPSNPRLAAGVRRRSCTSTPTSRTWTAGSWPGIPSPTPRRPRLPAPRRTPFGEPLRGGGKGVEVQRGGCEGVSRMGGEGSFRQRPGPSPAPSPPPPPPPPPPGSPSPPPSSALTPALLPADGMAGRMPRGREIPGLPPSPPSSKNKGRGTGVLLFIRILSGRVSWMFGSLYSIVGLRCSFRVPPVAPGPFPKQYVQAQPACTKPTRVLAHCTRRVGFAFSHNPLLP